ncbi:hypothetical protein J7I98_30920 [Streptomyces sp. ISL-98]|uniref:hypothetical protein n=1 Tax=Streptomyces sp. ISL-98 TaxID=2819192 RepID=UPI001BE55242|nr:hypothetical protein [Streptomyces sp. ISL-98]MBT2510190.1 hypothetical protein [Streptomyces sp. ISL-98]
MRVADDDDDALADRAFEAGMAAGLDPQEETGRTGETAVTHVSSPWNHRLCTTCGQSFRRGDPVRVGDGGAAGSGVAPDDVAHLDPALVCAAGPGEEPEGPGGHSTDSTASTEFAAGVLATWPPVDGVPVAPLTADDWQVARPAVHGARPPRCLYCAHTFRAGEHVVLCPCSPASPACGAAVHRDPAAGLVCWESWRPEGRLKICPVKLVAVRE